MASSRRCSAKTAKGEPCQATPRGDTGLCLWHDPDLAEAAQEARRLGGLKRKKEVTVRAAYDLESRTMITDLRRIVEIAVIDVRGLENSVARGRTLASLVTTAAKLLEVGEFAERLEAMESVMETRQKKGAKR